MNSESDEHIKTEWRARPLTSSTPYKINVSLRENADDATVEQWRALQNEKQFLRTITEDTNCLHCHFSIGQNQCGDYEMFDQSDKRIYGLPAISYKGNGALDRVLSILEHLATDMRNWCGIPSLLTKNYIQIRSAPWGALGRINSFFLNIST